MTLWLLLLAAVVAADISDIEYSWIGPESGCNGAPMGSRFNAYCTLPRGNVTVSVDRPASWIRITCEENSSFTCEELLEAKESIKKYITPTSTQENRTVDIYEITNCILPTEKLQCPLSLVDADDARLVILTEVSGEVGPIHVDGMTAINKLRIYYKDGENVSRVPYEVIHKLPALRSFSLRKGALVLYPTLDSGHSSLTQLRMLELAQGGLRSVPGKAFRNTPNLENLMLWGNQIEYVDEDAFVGLSRVVNMSLNNNQLSSLPPGVFQPCTQLAQLDLYVNQFLTLPRSLFHGLKQLYKVTLFDNSNATLHLDEGVFSNLPSLYEIILNFSNIQNLPDNLFANSTNLQLVSMIGNEIKMLPLNIFKDQKLRKLYLDRNKLEHVPAHVFSGQDMLEELNLSGNQLKVLSEGLLHPMKRLTTLNLDYNMLETLDRSVFVGLSELTLLSLTGNRIKHLESATFDVIPKLKVLYLAKNNMTISRTINTIRLQALYESAVDAGNTSPDVYRYHSQFRSLVNLNKLDLSHNQVSVMCDDWRQFFSLQMLDLSYNSFTDLTENDMNFSTDVNVDLQHNQIKSFRPAQYAENKYLPTFDLNDNPFTCDCYMYPFVDMRNGEYSPKMNIDNAVCSEPPSLKGTYLDNLSPDQLTCNITSCPTNCSCLIRPSKSQQEINCQTLPLTIPPKIDGFFTQLRLLENADLSQLPSNISYIDLSSLNLTESPRVGSPIEIDLSKNLLHSIPVDLLKQNCILHLADNPIDCSCEKRSDLEFLKQHRHLVKDYRNLTCNDRLSISGINIEQLCTARNSAIVGCTIAFLGVFIAVLTAVGYKYKTEIRIILIKYGLWWEDDEIDDKLYDAFISFSHQDEQYVMEELVPRLESGRRALKLCVHYRDWVIGDFIPSQIARSVEDSRRTIIVLSEHFLRSVWSQMEFRAAHAKQKLVVLMLEDLPADSLLDPDLKAYISTNTYARKDDPLVIDRLKDAVLRKCRKVAPPTNHKELANKKPVGLDVHLNEEGKLVNNALTAPSV